MNQETKGVTGWLVLALMLLTAAVGAAMFAARSDFKSDKAIETSIEAKSIATVAKSEVGGLRECVVEFRAETRTELKAIREMLTRQEENRKTSRGEPSPIR